MARGSGIGLDFAGTVSQPIGPRLSSRPIAQAYSLTPIPNVPRKRPGLDVAAADDGDDRRRGASRNDAPSRDHVVGAPPRAAAADGRTARLGDEVRLLEQPPHACRRRRSSSIVTISSTNAGDVGEGDVAGRTASRPSAMLAPAARR